MSELSDRVTEQVNSLKRVRDELRVQLDLGKKDAADAWAAVEKKWEAVEGKLGVIEREGKDAAHDIADATEVLLDEIKEGFTRIRKLL